MSIKKLIAGRWRNEMKVYSYHRILLSSHHKSTELVKHAVLRIDCKKRLCLDSDHKHERVHWGSYFCLFEGFYRAVLVNSDRMHMSAWVSRGTDEQGACRNFGDGGNDWLWLCLHEFYSFSKTHKIVCLKWVHLLSQQRELDWSLILKSWKGTCKWEHCFSIIKIDTMLYILVQLFKIILREHIRNFYLWFVFKEACPLS
jgi:hypothetical protein